LRRGEEKRRGKERRGKERRGKERREEERRVDGLFRLPVLVVMIPLSNGTGMTVFTGWR